MKAFVTSIGESTTELCVWALERNGFEVVLIQNGGLLVDKLKTIYETADQDFVRVDADFVPNKEFTPKNLYKLADAYADAWWLQFLAFDWLKLNTSHGGAQFIKREALPALRNHVDEFHREDRPETALSRVEDFYNPRRFQSTGAIAGIHGFASATDKRVIGQKSKRKYFATFDFELAERLEGLLK